jgi:uncharacterized protein YehS (DUF1456 family)
MKDIVKPVALVQLKTNFTFHLSVQVTVALEQCEQYIKKYLSDELGFTHFTEKVIDLVLPGLIVTSQSHVHALI